AAGQEEPAGSLDHPPPGRPALLFGPLAAASSVVGLCDHSLDIRSWICAELHSTLDHGGDKAMAPTPRHPGWTVQLNVHRAVRRDIARRADALADGGSSDVEAVRLYWAEAAFQLHHHHELEDTVIWPLLAERLGGRADSLLARNAREHETMVAAMDEFDAAFASVTTDIAAARRALGQLEEAIETHLRHEE